MTAVSNWPMYKKFWPKWLIYQECSFIYVGVHGIYLPLTSSENNTTPTQPNPALVALTQSISELHGLATEYCRYTRSFYTSEHTVGYIIYGQPGPMHTATGYLSQSNILDWSSHAYKTIITTGVVNTINRTCQSIYEIAYLLSYTLLISLTLSSACTVTGSSTRHLPG